MKLNFMNCITWYLISLVIPILLGLCLGFEHYVLVVIGGGLLQAGLYEFTGFAPILEPKKDKEH